MFNLLKCAARVPARYQTTLASLAKCTPVPCAFYLCATTHCGNSLAARSLAQKCLVASSSIHNVRPFKLADVHAK